jgi:hypothetical protein
MSGKSKYYCTKPMFDYSGHRQPGLIKLNKFYYVEVHEDVEFHQYISVIVYKLSGESVAIPKSNQYETFKPILEELFNDYYNYALKNLIKSEIDNGEFYLLKKNETRIQVEYYSENEKNQRKLTIDYYDGIEDLMLIIDSSRGHSGRSKARKKGLQITIEEFKQFLNLTMKFLSDHNSYKVYLDSYLKDFYSLVRGDNIIVGFDISAERAFKEILYQLDSRKTSIEKRLIENDNDSLEDRIRLRGEIDGINYAISTIKINK